MQQMDSKETEISNGPKGVWTNFDMNFGLKTKEEITQDVPYKGLSIVHGSEIHRDYLRGLMEV